MKKLFVLGLIALASQGAFAEEPTPAPTPILEFNHNTSGLVFAAHGISNADHGMSGLAMALRVDRMDSIRNKWLAELEGDVLRITAGRSNGSYGSATSSRVNLGLGKMIGDGICRYYVGGGFDVYVNNAGVGDQVIDNEGRMGLKLEPAGMICSNGQTTWLITSIAEAYLGNEPGMAVGARSRLMMDRAVNSRDSDQLSLVAEYLMRVPFDDLSRNASFLRVGLGADVNGTPVTFDLRMNDRNDLTDSSEAGGSSSVQEYLLGIALKF